MSEKSKILWQGFGMKCPKCGEGKLFRRYLVPYENCPKCNEDFISLRADDGPAWVTILLTGHIIVPLSYSFLSHDSHSLWVEISVIILAALSLVALILPRAKGVFMAAIWLSHIKKEPEE